MARSLVSVIWVIQLVLLIGLAYGNSVSWTCEDLPPQDAPNAEASSGNPIAFSGELLILPNPYRTNLGLFYIDSQR